MFTTHTLCGLSSSLKWRRGCRTDSRLIWCKYLTIQYALLALCFCAAPSFHTLTCPICRSGRLSHSDIHTATTNLGLRHRELTLVRHDSHELWTHASRSWPTDSHADQTPNAAARRLTLHQNENLTELYNGRVQLVK